MSFDDLKSAAAIGSFLLAGGAIVASASSVSDLRAAIDRGFTALTERIDKIIGR